MSLRRTVMTGLAFLVQPFASATAAAAPRPAACFSTSCLFGNPPSQIGSLKTVRTPSFICQAHFGRQFSSSQPLLGAAPAAAAATAKSSRKTSSSSAVPASSAASPTPRKSPRKPISKRGKPKFTNKYVEAAAAAAELLDLDLDSSIKIEGDVDNMNGIHLLNLQENQLLQHEDTPKQDVFLPQAIVLQDDAHPIREHLISGAAWTVLLRLRSAGHEAYIVGGTVRDILLNKIPKDYDILTSAEPSQIASLFPRAFVLGKSFPICHVHHKNEVIEVSSFGTNADPAKIPLDVAAMMEGGKRENGRKSGNSTSTASSRQGLRGGKKGRTSKHHILGEDRDDEFSDERLESSPSSSILLGVEGKKDSKFSIGISSSSGSIYGNKRENGPTWASARRDNAIKRDFRVNGLLYDPFSRILYDYVGGTSDCTARILRTMGSPTRSFSQDPARILRAVRLAARAGLIIEKETSDAMMALASTTAKLPQGRLQMELAAMFTHGAALPAMKLLWRYGLLDMLLPHHAVMLSKQKVPRVEENYLKNLEEIKSSSSTTTPNSDILGDALSASPHSVLYSLLAELDKTASSTEPADTAVWVTALAAPLVAQECQRVVSRRAAAKLRKQQLKMNEGDDEERSSSSSSNEWYDVDDAQFDPSTRNKSTTSTTSTTSLQLKTAAKTRKKAENLQDSGVSTTSPEYLDMYGKIVDKVMTRLLSKPDAKTQKQLAHIAPFAVPIGCGGGVKRKLNNSTTMTSSSNNGTDTDDSTDSSSISSTIPVLSCVFTRQAVEAARSFLKLEAELRGQDLESLVVKGSDKRGGGSGGGGGKRRSGAQQPRYLGRQRRGRSKLGANEYLVLQMLRAPEVQWVQATQLGVDEEED